MPVKIRFILNEFLIFYWYLIELQMDLYQVAVVLQ
jgi:hypothetical protein